MQFPIEYLAALACALPAQDFLAPPEEIPTGLLNTLTTAAADLDGDGVEDLIYTSLLLLQNSQVGVSVALGRPGGSFDLLRTDSLLPCSTAVYPGTEHQVLVADLSDDGLLDVVASVPSELPDTTDIFLLVGNGDGTFQPHELVARLAGSSVNNPRSVDLDVADMNGDSRPDLLIANRRSDFGFIASTPSGLSGPVVPFLAGGVTATLVVPGDFDGDGVTDLVARYFDGSASDTTSILLADQQGRFDITRSTLLGPNPASIEVVDFDLDGDLDFMLAGNGARIVRLIEQQAGGVLGAPLAFQGNPSPFNAGTVELADLEGDGLVDVIVRSSDENTVVIPNLGGFQFGPPHDAGGFASARGTTMDLNGDGLIDAVQGGGGFASAAARQSTRFVGTVDSMGRFRFVLNGTVTEYLDHSTTQFLDVDGDGLEDHVVYSFAAGQIVWRRSLGGSRFAEGELIMPVLRRDFAIGDVNGDGFDDIIGGTTQTVISVALGTGSGFLQGTVYATTASPLESIVAADVDADGFSDVVWAERSLRSIRSLKGTSSGPGQQDTLTSPQFTSFYLQQNIADLNQDGLLDLLISSGVSTFYAFGLPVGGFSAPTEILAGSFTNRQDTATAGDLDGDGLDDIVIPLESTMGWARNLGSGTFATAQPIAVGYPRSDVVLTDVDLDGDLDLTWSDSPSFSGDSALTWVENLGGGTFGPKTLLAQNALYESAFNLVTYRDVDQDGDPDAIFYWNGWLLYALNETLAPLGDSVCGAVVPNSTGLEGQLAVIGTTNLALNRVKLVASNLPTGSFGYFVCSTQPTAGQTVPGSVGILCLGGSIGRFSAPNQIGFSGVSGTFSLDVDVTMIPSPSLGLIPIAPGDTWVFQSWHRDVISTGSTSNFTDAKMVQF